MGEVDVFAIFSTIGIIAFAVSGAIVAMEEEYDILGVLVLGFVTAFGGGVIRNLLIGLPITMLWSQENSFSHRRAAYIAQAYKQYFNFHDV